MHLNKLHRMQQTKQGNEKDVKRQGGEHEGLIKT